MTELKKGYKKAEELLKDTDKLEEFLQKLEKKMELVPVAGSALAYIPIMISLIKSYICKEYRDIPLGSILAILSALIYKLSTLDLIPDIIPGLGQLDDIAVILACLKLVKDDLDDYTKWRERNGKIIIS